MIIILRLIISIVLFGLGQLSFGWSTQSRINTGINGDFIESISLYCHAGETLCEEVCDDQHFCWREQELCFNCLGTTNPMMRTIFSEIDKFYVNSFVKVPQNELAKIFQKNYIFIASKSIYNYYSAIDNIEILQRFRNLCPKEIGSKETASDTEPIVVIEKNSRDEPNKIKYIVCESRQVFDHEMYVLEYQPQVDVSDQLNINSDLNLK